AVQRWYHRRSRPRWRELRRRARHHPRERRHRRRARARGVWLRSARPESTHGYSRGRRAVTALAASTEVEARLAQRTDELQSRILADQRLTADRLFFWLLLVQWGFAILLAVTLSPYAWEGKARSIHLHVQIAVFLGGIINSLPLALIVLRPGAIS